jgi:hypothetical protein
MNDYSDWSWQKPTQTLQLDLFQMKRLKALSLLKVGEADLQRWVDQGWLSSTYAGQEELSQPAYHEIIFVRNIAQSGLYADDIERILMGLPKPYCYDPCRIAYSFKDGWIELPAPPDDIELDAFFHEHLMSWVERKKAERNDKAFLSEVLWSIFHYDDEEKKGWKSEEASHTAGAEE